jgi:hypothetical protein
MEIEKQNRCISLHVGGVREYAGWMFWNNIELWKNSLFEGRAPFCEEDWNQDAFDTTRNERTLSK